MSYINAPKLHQSTAFPWPLLVKISGALKWSVQHHRWITSIFPKNLLKNLFWPKSRVLQKVCVISPSWFDSLHKPKSASPHGLEPTNWESPERSKSIVVPPHSVWWTKGGMALVLTYILLFHRKCASSAHRGLILYINRSLSALCDLKLCRIDFNIKHDVKLLYGNLSQQQN